MKNTSEALKKAHEASRLRREAGIPTERLDPIQKSQRDPTSLRKAVTAKCWDCICAQNGDPNPRKTIRGCEITNCSLWAVRPFQKSKSEPFLISSAA